MMTGAAAAVPTPPARSAAASATIHPLPRAAAAETAATDRLIRLLASDRIRDLRDEGVTDAYIARMYRVSEPALQAVIRDELPFTRRR
jgi:hypothetical protein